MHFSFTNNIYKKKKKKKKETNFNTSMEKSENLKNKIEHLLGKKERCYIHNIFTIFS